MLIRSWFDRLTTNGRLNQRFLNVYKSKTKSSFAIYFRSKIIACAGHCAAGSRVKPLLANCCQRPIT